MNLRDVLAKLGILRFENEEGRLGTAVGTCRLKC